jgi:hypothetical protein
MRMSLQSKFFVPILSLIVAGMVAMAAINYVAVKGAFERAWARA